MEDSPPQIRETTPPTTDFETCRNCKKLFRRTLKPEAIASGQSLFVLRGNPNNWLEDLEPGLCSDCTKKMRERWEKESEEIERKLKESEEIKRKQIEKEQSKKMIEALDATKMGGKRPFNLFKFENFKRELSPKWFELANKVDMSRENVYVYGPTGVGKTFLATALVRSAWDTPPQEGHMFTMDTMMDAYYDNLGSDKRKALRKITSLTRIGLDDLGIGTVTDTKVEFLEHFLDGRLNLDVGGLIITSNDDLNLTKVKYGVRIADRIYELCRVIEIPETTPSARGLKKKRV